MTDQLTPEVRHDEARRRYSLVIGDDTVGFVDYVLTPREVRFTHTEIDPRWRRQGLAGILIEYALNDFSTNSRLTVVPQCPYVAQWIDDHAEYQDLLVRGR
ncbi:hypothetical protein JF66_08385 [Cryobacterium sp. MLB-32]|uniref:GNAT family N-acetyltransferase n=1 Tax=Cryobacterium sp. MLB-32 TaxID=1529318 RepID=UPI0004E650BE|nr:GNAT family N-acetyltransferase [Cryobacterium sp. MLB-32]KFF59865.1 hypothetical protein JF66_08385 [Cryobacterium sp. MLB-32]